MLGTFHLTPKRLEEASMWALMSKCPHSVARVLRPRKAPALALLCCAGLSGCDAGGHAQVDQRQILSQVRQATCERVDGLYAAHGQAPWTVLRGRVIRLLPDAQGRYQHQRFIVLCPSGHTVLIVNDVSIGQRASVTVGDQVAVRGEYVWNAQGGLLHFTHHDDLGGPGGWIAVGNHVYS